MADDDTLKPSGSGEPQSPIPAAAPDLSAAATQVVSQVSMKARSDFIRDGVIDTHRLGSEPLGKQAKRNGPERQKFFCSRCRMRRWIIDSEAGCAASLTRFTICSLCEAKDYADRLVRRETNVLKADLEKLRQAVEEGLSSFEDRLGRIVGEHSRSAVVVSEQPALEHISLRNDLQHLRGQLMDEVHALEARIIQRSEEEQRSLHREQSARMVDVTVAAQRGPGTTPPGDCEAYIDQMYRRVVQGERLNVHLEKGEPPGGSLGGGTPTHADACARSSKKEKKKKKKRNRRRKQAEKRHKGEAVTLLLGDSLVGGATESNLTSLRPEYRCGSYPGAGIKRITSRVKALEPASENTLVLMVGGNDFFGRNGRTGDVGTLLRDYRQLLEAARQKTNRVVVVGLVPRKYRKPEEYRRAVVVNRQLMELCRARKFRYLDPWEEFVGVDKFFAKDGLHFSKLGSKVMANMIHHKVFTSREQKLPERKNRSKKIPRKRPNKKTGSKTRLGGATVAVDSNNNVDIPVVTQATPGASPVLPAVRMESESAVVVEEITVASTPAATEASSNKRQRSPELEILDSPVYHSPVRRNKRRRRRASEGETPELGSPPVTAERRQSPPPTGNEQHPE